MKVWLKYALAIDTKILAKSNELDNVVRMT